MQLLTFSNISVSDPVHAAGSMKKCHSNYHLATTGFTSLVNDQTPLSSTACTITLLSTSCLLVVVATVVDVPYSSISSSPIKMRNKKEELTCTLAPLTFLYGFPISSLPVGYCTITEYATALATGCQLTAKSPASLLLLRVTPLTLGGLDTPPTTRIWPVVKHGLVPLVV